MPDTPETAELADGYLSYDAGMDSGRDPTAIAPNQVALAINATMRDYFPRCRPPWKKRVLDFQGAADAQAIFETAGIFQHGSWYRPDFGDNRLIAVISGRFYVIYPKSGNKVQEITPYRLDSPNTKDPNPALNVKGWSDQGEQFWIYNDGGSLPLIYDGASSRRATPQEIKPGTAIQYVQGRFWYSLPNGLAFRATDLVYSDSGTPIYRYRDAILKETENIFLNEGGDFGIPFGAGRIRAMRAFSVLDTSQGQGPLQVGTENAVFSVNTPVDRTTWKDLQYPIQTVSLISFGPLNQQGTVNVNGDLFYRSTDGIRSFVLARRDFRTWGNVPQSSEMNGVINLDRTDFLDCGSAVNFDGRLLMTASPMFSYRGIYHRGLIALDFSPVSSMQRQSPPAYDGLWTGLKIFTLVQTPDACYAFVLGKDNKIELWELLTKGLFDNDTVRIQWSIDGRAFNFQSQFNKKKLTKADLRMDSMSGSVDWAVKWRSDQYPCWVDWASGTQCANYCDTIAPVGNCTPSIPLQPQYRPKIKLPMPPDSCNDTVQMRMNDFYELQPRIEITGQARLKQFRLRAENVPESEGEDCNDGEDCKDLRCCLTNNYSFQSDP